MKGKLIGYSHTYMIGTTDFEKIWYEGELEEGDDIRQCLYKAKKIVSDFHFESNKADEKKKEIAKQGKAQEVKPTTVEDINSCKDLTVLHTYRLIVKSNPVLQKAYDEMYKKLSPKHKTKLP